MEERPEILRLADAYAWAMLRCFVSRTGDVNGDPHAELAAAEKALLEYAERLKKEVPREQA